MWSMWFKSVSAFCIIILTVKCATTESDANETAIIKIWATVNDQEYSVELTNFHADAEPGDTRRQRNVWSVVDNTPINIQTTHWTKIKFNQPSLNKIPPFNFENYSNVGAFEMSHHNLTEIGGLDFQNAASLWNFNLSHNNIEQIFGGAFENCPRIEELDLSYNQIHHIAEEAFSELLYLKILYLQYNRLTVSCLNWIDEPITQLTINNNFDKYIIQMNKIIRGYTWESFNFIVDISNNPPLSNGLNLLAANEMDLRNNSVESVTISPQTKRMSMPFNRITRVELEASAAEFHLISLNLSHNSLASVPNLLKLEHLEDLDLSFNRIEILEQGSFHEGHLKTVNLSHNQIAAIDAEQFLSLVGRYTWSDCSIFLIEYDHYLTPKIYILDLSGNPLAKSAEFLKVRAKAVHQRRNGLEQLTIYPQTRELEAQNNRMSEIVLEGTEADVYELNSLNLTQNEFTTIPTAALSKLARLKSLDLSFNRIEFIADDALSGSSFRQLRQIYLQNNRIASPKWEQIVSPVARFVLNDNSVARMESRHIPLTSLTDYYENGKYPTRHLDVSNNPFVNTSEAIRVIADHMDLRNNGIERVVVFPQTTKLEAQHNRITQIVLEGTLQEFNLTALNLTNNLLTSISALANLSKLEEFDLSYNILGSLDLTTFDKSNRLRWISLSNNHLKTLNIGYNFNTANLVYLDISYNHLESLRVMGLFPQLQTLNIAGNNLTELDTFIRRRAPQLATLELNDNKWDCDYLTNALISIPYGDIVLGADRPIKHWERNYTGRVINIFCFDAEDGKISGKPIERGLHGYTIFSNSARGGLDSKMNTQLDSKFESILDVKLKKIEVELLVHINTKFYQLSVEWKDLKEFIANNIGNSV